MSLTLDVHHVRAEMGRRGWTQVDLAEAAGISQPTVSAALAGRPIKEKSARAIAAALKGSKPNPAIERILLSPEAVA